MRQQKQITISRCLAPVFLCLLSLALYAKRPYKTTFPLKLSANGKYLTDKNNVPFLIKEISAWGLIQALSESDEAAFMDSVKAKGFNTLMVSIISFDMRFAGGPPNWQGISPFNTQWDLSTYNSAYFEHADRFLRMAQSKGILVLLVPCYLGYKGDSTQGWWAKLLSPNNSVQKSRQYGRFLGQRYKDFDNIIWEAGGDNKGEELLFSHLDNIIQGIKEIDTKHLWTGHFESAHGTNWAAQNALYAKYIDIDGLYVFTEDNMGDDAPQYKTELARYGQGKPIFQLDQSYEHDIPHNDNNENYQWIRRKNYDGMLSGCAGTSFSPGQKDNQCYVFKNWRPLMSTTGMQQMQYCFYIFDHLPWYRMHPLATDENIIGSRGQFGSIDYVCAAISNDSTLLVAYLPVGHSISVNFSALHGNVFSIRWFNMSNGHTWPLQLISDKAIKTLTPHTSEDWLLIIQKRKR